MSKKGAVYCNRHYAGIIEYNGSEYVFTYDTTYLDNRALPPIALSFSKRQREYHSQVLFPFFYGLLAEGDEKALQCVTLKIDENDHFTRLLKTAGSTTIGAVTVQEIE